MLESMIGRWRLHMALRTRTTGTPCSPTYQPARLLWALYSGPARDWLHSRRIYDVRALGPSSPPA